MTNRWRNSGNSVRLILGGSKITADDDCSHEIQDACSLEKAMTNLDSILKSRDITLPTKVHLVKAMILPVVMYRCESWTIKKAEHQRIDDFELWCWRRLLRVPWTARRSNQSNVKEVKVKIAQLCLTLCDPMDYTIYGILQARIVEWVSLSLLQGIFPTQGLNPGLWHCRQILYQLSHRESPT